MTKENDSSADTRHDELPDRLIRIMQKPVQVDVEKRILDNVVFVTRGIASDGGILAPSGIVKAFYEENPIVKARHGLADFSDPRSSIIGRSLGLRTVEDGFAATTQFADTDLGREYAYLYGVNTEGEVYARAWSFGWTTLSLEWWGLDRAKAWLGDLWDDDLVPPFVKREGEVWVALRSLMHEYSAVENGADKKSLTRAHEKGIRVAGEILTRINFREAVEELNALKTVVTETSGRMQRLEQSILALSRDGTAAAEPGNTAEVLESLRALRVLVRGDKQE